MKPNSSLSRLSILICAVFICVSALLQAEDKPLIKGFMLRAAPGMKVIPKRGTRSTFVPIVSGADATLVFAEWNDLQPEKFGKIHENNIIDQALKAVSEWNKKNPKQPVRLRLRVFSGIYAPDWVMAHAGAIQVDYRKKKSSTALLRSTPKFWTLAYQEAWSDLQKKLAAKYDNNPLICDVSISGSMTLHTEVMWRQPGFPYVISNLMKGGLTRENDLTCLRNDITRFMEIWKETPVEMTFNTCRKFTLIGDTHQPSGPDTEFSNTLLQHIATEATRLKKSYMIGNHSLSDYAVIQNKKYTDKNHILYALRQQHLKNKTPLYFQTEVFTANIVEELIREGLKMGASLIELPNDITAQHILKPELQRLRQQLKSHPSPSEQSP